MAILPDQGGSTSWSSGAQQLSYQLMSSAYHRQYYMEIYTQARERERERERERTSMSIVNGLKMHWTYWETPFYSPEIEMTQKDELVEVVVKEVVIAVVNLHDHVSALRLTSHQEFWRLHPGSLLAGTPPSDTPSRLAWAFWSTYSCMPTGRGKLFVNASFILANKYSGIRIYIYTISLYLCMVLKKYNIWLKQIQRTCMASRPTRPAAKSAPRYWNTILLAQIKTGNRVTIVAMMQTGLTTPILVKHRSRSTYMFAFSRPKLESYFPLNPHQQMRKAIDE